MKIKRRQTKRVIPRLSTEEAITFLEITGADNNPGARVSSALRHHILHALSAPPPLLGPFSSRSGSSFCFSDRIFLPSSRPPQPESWWWKSGVHPRTQNEWTRVFVH
ncbi:hypothetical protein AVEN_188387-1 [Araneus ventricosus]|uniref:Uncharacterized protein n=1 Tax=Araneus ventricosus TaxID=182803 RepID=A0A4Y2E9G9_ARAVE|nr:hypothetical protein AVEN_188387-1 [Araneus ventricosus]